MKSSEQMQSLSRRHFLGAAGAVVTAATVMGAGAEENADLPAGQAAESNFLCGWASASITPDMPVQLAGQFAERVSQKVLDPCMANVLAIEGRTPDGTVEQAVLVSCDVVHIPKEVVDGVRERIARDLPEVDAQKIVLAATHTHTGPTMMSGVYKEADPGVMGPEAYREFLMERVAEVITQAWNARRPAGMSRAVGHAAVGFNRIMVYADGSMVMYGKTDKENWRGPLAGQDHGMELLFTWDVHKKLTGMVINIACPSQVVEGQLYVSPDFWGPVREELRKRFSPELGVLAVVSAAGDQSPRDLVRRGRNEPDMRSEPGMREMAKRIVNGVLYAMETAQTDVVWSPTLIHQAGPLELPARKVTDEEAEEARAEEAKLTASGEITPGSGNAALLRRARGVLERYESQGDAPTYIMDLHVLRLGDVALATNPFELYLDYGLQIKARSRAEQTFLIQLANDRGAYLPTQDALSGGAYSSRVADNKVGPEGGAALVETTLTAINAMWPA